MGKVKPTIILLGPTAPKFKGGIVHYTYNLYQEFKKQNFDINLISFKRSYPKKFFPGAQTQDLSEKQFLIKTEKDLLDWLNPISWYQTFSNIKKLKPKIIVFQWWTWFWALPYLFILLLVKFFTQMQIIFIVHNPVDHEKNIMKSFLAKSVLKFANKIIVNSSEAKAYLQKEFPNKEIIFTFHPLYDFMKPKKEISQEQAQHKLKIHSPLLLFFGHIRKYKGLDLLIKALAQANNKLSKKVKLIVAGEFWEDKQKYLNIIKKNKLDEQIVLFSKYINNEDVEKYFSATDAVVIPYYQTTGAGPAKIALAFDKPLIATNTGDNIDLFKIAEIGKLVKPSVKELSNAIIDFFQEPKIKYLANINKVKKELGWDKLVKKIVNE